MPPPGKKEVFTWDHFYEWCDRVRRDIKNLEKAMQKLDKNFNPGDPGDPGDPPKGPFA